MAGKRKKRCLICGKSIEPGSTIFRITRGKLSERYTEGREFGLAHEDCFHRDFPSPEAALRHIQDLSAS